VRFPRRSPAGLLRPRGCEQAAHDIRQDLRLALEVGRPGIQRGGHVEVAPGIVAGHFLVQQFVDQVRAAECRQDRVHVGHRVCRQGRLRPRRGGLPLRSPPGCLPLQEAGLVDG